MFRKGIIMAGGYGTRMGPLTKVVNKHLLPVYDKPMIYYPLTTLMLAGIKDILIITNPESVSKFKNLFYMGGYGITISLAEQPKPHGIAQAFLIAQDWLRGEGCALILGDNIFYGAGLGDLLQGVTRPTIFTQWVKDPERYGVYDGYVIEEKPKKPKTNWAVTGLYFYGPTFIKVAQSLKPSERGELEITDLNNIVLRSLDVQRLGRGFAWFDAGTPDSLLDASNFIRTVQDRQGLQIGNPDEVAKNMGFI